MNNEEILLKIKEDCEKIIELIEKRKDVLEFDVGVKSQAMATLSIIKNATLKGKK